MELLCKNKCYTYLFISRSPVQLLQADSMSEQAGNTPIVVYFWNKTELSQQLREKIDEQKMFRQF